MTQIDFFSLWAAPLPDEQELARWYSALNRRYFGNSLPSATVRWSDRMRIAGTCDGRRRTITLSRIYHTQFPEDVEDTLKHEMIHLRHHRHDADFRREAQRIDATVNCKDYPGLHPRARFVYICPNCRTVFHRSKQECLYCGRCARHRLDSRFALVLRSTKGHQRAIKSLAARRPRKRRPRRAARG